jgi:hypothetical protein
MPLVSWGRWYRSVGRLIKRNTGAGGVLGLPSGVGAGAAGAAAAAAGYGTACPVCAADPPELSYEADCGHFFCYFCLQGVCAAGAEGGGKCPKCLVPIDSSRRLDPPVAAAAATQ